MRISESFTPQAPVRFIVVEGVNGAGKGTLLSSLGDKIAESGIDYITTLEPGGSELGKRIREMVLSKRDELLDPLSELFLFLADRAEHVTKVLQPAIERGAVILCDRYFYSTVAFQGFGRGLGVELTETLCETAVRGVYPDLVVLLDLDPEEGLRRNSRTLDKQGRDVLEAEKLEFHTKVREGFLSLASSRPEPFLVIDASRPAEQVAEQAWRTIEPWLKR